MVKELNYTTIVSPVIDSWEALRRIENYEEAAGVLLFQSLFEKCPDAKALFGFPIDMDPKSSELTKSKRFKGHAVYLIQMFDSALNMLGPDMDFLTEMLLDLGDKHARYGVTPDMFDAFGAALVEALERVLEEHEMTDFVKQAWKELYGELVKDMLKKRASPPTTIGKQKSSLLKV